MKKNFFWLFLLILMVGSFFLYKDYETKKEKEAYVKTWNEVAVPVINSFSDDLACELKLKNGLNNKGCKVPRKGKKEEVLVVGKVIDEAGNPISEVDVLLNEVKIQTYKAGYFSKKIGVDVNQRRLFLTIHKTGYVPFFKVFNLNNLKRSLKNELKMEKRIFEDSFVLKEAVTQQVKISTVHPIVVEKTVGLEDKTIKLFIPPNVLIDERGKLASGQAFVQLSYLDVQNPDDLKFLPTMTYLENKMLGVDLKGNVEEVKMPGVIFARIYQIEGDGTEKDLFLNKEGWTIVSYPITEKIASLYEGRYWHFDQEVGMWLEESTQSWINGKTGNWEVKTKLLF